MEQISEAFNKCFVADFIFSISRTIEDKQNNQGKLFIAKNRNGPDGMVYEYSHGVRMIEDPDYRPKQYPFTPESFCVWGSKPDIPEFQS